MSKILVVGSLNMDLVINTPKMPSLGETVLGRDFMTVPGGKGANQAVAIAKLGGEVRMIGCVGGDTFGNALIANLNDNNVDTKNIKIVESSPTGIAIIVVYDGDNFIIVDPGANQYLTPKIVDEYEPLIKESFLLVIQLEIPLPTVERAISLAKRHNVKVLLNPAPACPLSDSLLSMVDILIPNESECRSITGVHIKNANDAKTAAKYLLSRGISQLIITLGADGVIYNKADEIIYKPAHKVKVVDTTAAGDSFTAAIACAVSQNKSIDEAIEFANAVGGITVTKMGAQTSLPFLYEVIEFMKFNP